MKTNLNLRAIIFSLVFVMISSCRNDSSLASSSMVENTNASKIKSKSLWKEDEIFINNVRVIFDKNYNITSFSKKFGDPLWDYGMSMGNFDETFAVVPLLKNHVVQGLMHIERKGDKVFFTYEKNAGNVNFFNIFYKTNKEKIIPKNDSSTNSFSRLVCETRSYCYGYDDGVGVAFQWVSYTFCYDDGTTMILYNDYGGGGDGFGYNGADASFDLYQNISPNFKMKKSDVAAYPKFANTVIDIANYVSSNTKVMSTLKKYTGLNEQQILDKLKFGQGPNIEITDLNGAYGYHNPLTNTVQIDVKYVNMLENSTVANAAIMKLFLSIVLLHEFVHWTDGLFFDWPQENGENWEIATYGFIVDHNNVILIKR